jgi:hypothetical protein
VLVGNGVDVGGGVVSGVAVADVARALRGYRRGAPYSIQ